MAVLFGRMGAVGFGGAPLGNLFAAVGDDQARDAVRAARAGGIRYFDTAPHYGLGLSERRLGEELRDGKRDETVISTKVGRLLRPDPSPRSRDDEGFDVPGGYRRVWDFTVAGMRRSMDESLERLGVDAVDIVFAHDPDRLGPWAVAEAVASLVELKREGIVGAIGIGTNTSDHLGDYLGVLDVVLLAGRHNLLEHRAVETLLDPAEAAGIGVIIAGAFASGILATPDGAEPGRYDYRAPPAEVVARTRLIAEVCRRHGATLAQAAIAFPAQHPAVRNVLLGMRSAREVGSNLEALRRPPPAALWAELVDRGLIAAVAIRSRPV